MNHATLTSTADRPGIGAEATLERGGGLDFLAIRRKVGAALFPGSDMPATIARFRILEQLGSGTMGTVYSAWDPELERRVAIKVLAWHAPSATRMKREAKALARLNHPNVVTVHEVGTVGDQVFLAMEFVRGRTLGEVLDNGSSARETVALYLQAAEGLAAAHEAGLVHRDFKPENVMVGEDGRVRVLDFGLARPVGALPPEGGEVDGVPVRELPIDALTRTGALIGTPAYMAPEQLIGAPADAKSDQFAWCVCVWEVLTGRRPWEAETLDDLVGRITHSAPAVPKRSALPGALRRVLLRGLAADPDARWPDMKTLVAEVRRSQRGRGPALLLAAGGVAMVGLGALAFVGATAPICGDVEDVWTDAAEAALVASDASPGRIEAFAEAMDLWSDRWNDARTAACDGDTEAHARARACVEDLHGQAQGLVAAFTAAPVERFGDRLGPWPLDEPTLCRPEGPGTGLPPVPAEAAQDVARLRLQIERDYFRHADHLYFGEQDDLDATRDAEAIGYAPLVAEAMYADAVRRRYHSEYDEAERLAKDAVETAQAVGHAVILAKARLLLAEVALSAGRADAAVAALLDEADRAVERIDPERQAMADRLRYDLALLLAGSPDEAIAGKATTRFEDALRLLPQQSSVRAEALESFAEHLEEIGDDQGAARRWAEVVAIWRALVEAADEGAPRGHARSRLAWALAQTGALEEAIEQERLALEVAGDGASARISTGSIADWLLELQRIDEAERTYRELAAIVEEGDVGDERRTADIGLARVAVARDDLATAEERFAAVLDAGFSPYIATLLAWVRLAEGKTDAALGTARQAYEAERRQYALEDAGLNNTRLALAAAHVAGGEFNETIALVDHDYVLQRDDDGFARHVLALALRGLGRDEQRAAELEAAAATARAAERKDPRYRMVRRTQNELIDRALQRIAQR